MKKQQDHESRFEYEQPLIGKYVCKTTTRRSLRKADQQNAICVDKPEVFIWQR
jgi:hypothetical protein